MFSEVGRQQTARKTKQTPAIMYLVHLFDTMRIVLFLIIYDDPFISKDSVQYFVTVMKSEQYRTSLHLFHVSCTVGVMLFFFMIYIKGWKS